MRPILSAIASGISFRFRSRASLELEVIALRHQLNYLRRKQRKVFLPLRDRLFWVWLYRIWPKALSVLVLVKPATLMHWHYLGFRLYWRHRSGCGDNNRKVDAELRGLIYLVHRENPLWGARRIAGELRKLGFEISSGTVRRYLPIRPTRPGPGWRAFLANHMHETAAIDFAVIVTFGYKLMYVLVLMNHGRRKILHLAVTYHPTQEWVAAQLQLAFNSNPRPKYLVRDRDRIYGSAVRETLKRLGIREKVTAKQSPWQNIYVERVIYNIRRDCLDHILVRNEAHLQRVLDDYLEYYNYSRTHWAFGHNDSPVHRNIERPAVGDKIVSIPLVRGLHHRYERRAA